MKLLIRGLMKNIIALFSLLLLSISTFASTPSSAVAQLDEAREGNLSEYTLKYFTENLKIDCGIGSLAKFEILKLSSGSANEAKTENTPFSYDANYLVTQKCLTGTTYAGAYLDVVKAVVLKASFTSEYNEQNGPKKMEGLKIEVAKDMTEALKEL